MNSKKETKIRITNEMLASKEKRFANFIIDMIVRFIVTFLIGVLIAMYAQISGNEELLYALENISTLADYAISYVFLLIYYMIFESITGRTIGKYFTNTKVLMIDGSKPEADKILYRSLSRIVPFEGFSFLGNEAKGWHDTWSDTVVVDLKKYNEIKNSIDSISEIGSEI